MMKIRNAVSVMPSEASWFASTRSRVRSNTVERINQQIDAAIDRNIRYFAQHPDEIDKRLMDLDEEWDIERAIEASAAVAALGGFGLAVAGDRRFLVVPFLVAVFLLQHAVQGWCPPIPILRRLGFRTADEINRERAALKLLRGDYASVQRRSEAVSLARAVRTAD